jgi:hypothetical protein
VSRAIHIQKPGTTAFTVAFVQTDAEDATARARAASEGLVAGATMEIKPDPTIWGVTDYIKRHHAGR